MARRRWQARPLTAPPAGRRTVDRPRPATLLSWAAAAVALVALAFVVGRPAAEQGVLAGTPIASRPPLPIAFGTDLDPATNQATGTTRRFRAGDAFAYSVTLPAPPGTEEILVEVARLEPDGGRTVIQEASVQRILPQPRTFAFRVTTDDLLAAWGPGDYLMTIWIDLADGPVATGRFTLVQTPS